MAKKLSKLKTKKSEIFPLDFFSHEICQFQLQHLWKILKSKAEDSLFFQKSWVSSEAIWGKPRYFVAEILSRKPISDETKTRDPILTSEFCFI